MPEDQAYTKQKVLENKATKGIVAVFHIRMNTKNKVAATQELAVSGILELDFLLKRWLKC
ncbi:hypothetical protein BWQ96_06210 [Gracilariopsis chorda]|uniref:Uncharacterized protein n=1 Tax=Gracilariopsis chorda TaxID=448386 RepID=A0A2V3IPQ3_9FLOR|nr:hypothetical protein BWQ96_06210 [Gracilariopsis chorda]|eukprot:PXF44037.1 hypothetical protein BWQ96_06210 [Gracilariopsis chorda]